MLRKLTVNEKWPNNNLFNDKQYYINESQITNKELNNVQHKHQE